jgi:hypothetical protein
VANQLVTTTLYEGHCGRYILKLFDWLDLTKERVKFDCLVRHCLSLITSLAVGSGNDDFYVSDSKHTQP